jgi:plasmid stabilization system protein ParE
MQKIFYTDSARADLIDAWLFVAEENLPAADRMLETIQGGIQLLAQQPLLGRDRSELRAGLRSWPTSTPYILYYVVEPDGLTLIRVLHHARDVHSIDLLR